MLQQAINLTLHAEREIKNDGLRAQFCSRLDQTCPYMLWEKSAGGVWVIDPGFLVSTAPQITDYLEMIWVSKYWGPNAVENSQL